MPSFGAELLYILHKLTTGYLYVETIFKSSVSIDEQAVA